MSMMQSIACCIIDLDLYATHRMPSSSKKVRLYVVLFLYICNIVF